MIIRGSVDERWLSNKLTNVVKRKRSRWPCLRCFLQWIEKNTRKQLDPRQTWFWPTAGKFIHGPHTTPRHAYKAWPYDTMEQQAICHGGGGGGLAVGWWVTPEKCTAFPIGMWTESPKVVAIRQLRGGGYELIYLTENASVTRFPFTHSHSNLHESALGGFNRVINAVRLTDHHNKTSTTFQNPRIQNIPITLKINKCSWRLCSEFHEICSRKTLSNSKKDLRHGGDSPTLSWSALVRGKPSAFVEVVYSLSNRGWQLLLCIWWSKWVSRETLNGSMQVF